MACGGQLNRAAQLTLQFPLDPRYTLGHFQIGENAEALKRLAGLAREGPGFRGILLSGAAGVGKTHLLQGVCRDFGTGAMYLPLATVGPELLDGLETLALVALDDLDAWLGDADREAALLALYQGLLAHGGCLLLAARQSAGQSSFRYPDLGSRLRALPGYRIRGLDDPGKSRVLQRVALERGLVLAPAVLDFWLSRGPRDLALLLAQLDELDAAALAAQRRVTVPLLKQVLGL